MNAGDSFEEQPSCNWPFVSEHDKNSQVGSFTERPVQEYLGKMATVVALRNSNIPTPETLIIEIHFNRNSRNLQYQNQPIDPIRLESILKEWFNANLGNTFVPLAVSNFMVLDQNKSSIFRSRRLDFFIASVLESLGEVN